MNRWRTNSILDFRQEKNENAIYIISGVPTQPERWILLGGVRVQQIHRIPFLASGIGVSDNVVNCLRRDVSKERRAFCRLEPCEFTTTSVHDSEVPPAYGVLSNISELGLCLETHTLFAPGQDVRITICLNPLSILIRADGRIMWTRSETHRLGRTAESFLLGTKITWMPNADRRCLHWALSTSHFKKEPSVDSKPEPEESRDNVQRFQIAEQIENQSAVLQNGPPRVRSWKSRSAIAKKSDQSRTYNGAVLIIRQGIPFVGRLCRLVNAAGYNAKLTNSPETVVSKVRVLKPSLVLLSHYVGNPGVSETARRIKAHSGQSETPIAILTDHYSKPYLLEYAYPVEACLPIDGDETALIQNIRLVARKRKGRQDRPFGALEGKIERDTLSEILLYLSTARKTGCVIIKTGQRIGRIYLDQGELVHARLGPLDGIEACHSILGFLQEGYFKFEPDVHPSRITMQEHGEELILRAAEEIDEHQRRWRPESSDSGAESA